MRRVIILVDERADCWSVAVRTRDAASEPVDLVPPYTMHWTMLGDRRVPVVPEDRLPLVPDDDLGGRIAQHRLLCAGDHDELSALLRRIRSGTPGVDDVARYGCWLFECLLAPAWAAIRAHPDVLRHKAVEIALRWPASETALHRLVWEAMYDGNVPLAGHTVIVAVTRLVPTAPIEVETIVRVPRVLFATSVALSDPTIRPGAMFMGLLRGLDTDGRCRARAVHGVSDDKLREACASFRPDVVHLVAHGALLPDGRGALMLPGDSGHPEPTDATALFAALSTGGHRPLAVVLSACNSATGGEILDDTADATSLAAELVAAGIPVVSAMAGEVSEFACRLYTRKLAEAMHDGQPVVLAAAHGRRAALVGSRGPRADINWALPALFLAEDLDPSQAMVDATSSRALIGLANHLRLRKEPLFVGRNDVITAADRMVEPGAMDCVLAVLAKGDTSRLGGTRLLREIGWRLLRDGHLPILIGPFSKPGQAPDTARKLLYELLLKVQAVLTYMDLPPFVPELVSFSLPSDERATLIAAVDEDIGCNKIGFARSRVNRALRAYSEGGDDLTAAVVRDLLCADLATLANRAAEWGTPFGPHTRIVVLCDDIHHWGSTGVELSGLDCLLEMLEPSGLGSVDRPAPVVLTGSKTLAGEALSTWLSNATSGFLSLELGEISAADAVVGYQWVLLHSWKNRPAGESQRFGHVYTAIPDRVRQWEETLRAPELRRPTTVEDLLYLLAWSAVTNQTCRSDDDEQAWRSYAEQNPGSQW